KWRISDAEQFYQSTSGGDEGRAESIVGQKIQDGIKNEVAGRTLKQIVTSDRQEIVGDFMARATEELGKFGIQLIDVRIQRIDLQEDVAARVYESMKQGFEGIARTQRGEGDRESQIIKSNAERKRTEIIAKANAEAQRIRGEGESTAAGIYAAAYSRNPEFYSFYRSLQAYRTSLGREGDVLVISPDSEFFRYLRTPTPQRR
ncbi:MAG TPA: protease modulator HflC, partial [Steroidobacteraceae bacterium]|nr:protease modulator HflC [Steroidobacteraceae bacterium]